VRALLAVDWRSDTRRKWAVRIDVRGWVYWHLCPRLGLLCRVVEFGEWAGELLRGMDVGAHQSQRR